MLSRPLFVLGFFALIVLTSQSHVIHVGDERGISGFTSVCVYLFRNEVCSLDYSVAVRNPVIKMSKEICQLENDRNIENY